MRLWAAVVLSTSLAGCAVSRGVGVEPPQLRLSPASLGKSIALQQVLTVESHGVAQQVDMALEADDEAVRLAVLQMGQVVARLEWDGTTLREQRAVGWPAEVNGERVLGDLQWVHWPIERLREALPAGWTLDAAEGSRTLKFNNRAVIEVRQLGPDVIQLENFPGRYTLRIESRAAGVKT